MSTVTSSLTTGTAGTIPSEVAPNGTLLILPTSKPGELILARKDGALGLRNTHRIALRLIPARDREICLRAMGSKDVQVLIETIETLEVADPVTATKWYARIKPHSVLEFPYDPAITVEVIKTVLGRHVGVIGGANAAELASHISSLMQGDLRMGLV